MNYKKCKELFAELVLVVAGVFVFRGMWTLLDKIEFMHSKPALWLSMILGLAATTWAVGCLIRLKATDE